MERRSFMSGTLLALSLLSIKPEKLLAKVADLGEYTKPKAIKAGDCIGVIAPGTAVTDPDEISRAKEALDYFGLKMKLGKYVLHGNGYKSRSIKERLEDLHSMFTDQEVNAVIAIRGGYGSAQLLDGINYDLIHEHPKIFLGYSDITAMHLAINKIAKIVTFHGPVLLSTFNDYTIKYFRKAVFETNPIGEVKNSTVKNAFREDFPVRMISGGKCGGKLVGGNLSLISATLGTPYEIDTKGKILFIEDVGEQPYRIDRMLTQLRLAGKLKDAVGIVVGYCKDCDYEGLKPSRVWDYSLGEILDEILSPLKIPVISGLTFGHTSNQITLPLGVEAVLDADNKSLMITEAGVA